MLRIEVSKENIASIIRVTRTSELTTLAIITNRTMVGTEVSEELTAPIIRATRI
jgi:hypothetical protein